MIERIAGRVAPLLLCVGATACDRQSDSPPPVGEKEVTQQVRPVESDPPAPKTIRPEVVVTPPVQREVEETKPAPRVEAKPTALEKPRVAKPAVEKKTQPEPVTGPDFSARAKEVARLLDKGKVDGARHLLKSYLPQYPGDVGLIAQEIRVLLFDSEMTLPPVPDFASVLFPVVEKFQTACDLDDTFKDYIAEQICETVCLKLEGAANARKLLMIADAQFMDREVTLNLFGGGEMTEAEKAMFGMFFPGGGNKEADLNLLRGLQLQFGFEYGHQFQSGNWCYFITEAKKRSNSATKYAARLEAIADQYTKNGMYSSAVKLSYTAGFLRDTTWAGPYKAVDARLAACVKEGHPQSEERTAAALNMVSTFMRKEANDAYSRDMMGFWIRHSLDWIVEKSGESKAKLFLKEIGVQPEKVQEWLDNSAKRIESRVNAKK